MQGYAIVRGLWFWRMMRLELSQLRSLLSSDNFDRQRDVAKSIIVLFSATETQMQVCWCRGDVDQSPITEADVDFRRFNDDGPTYLLPTSLWVEQSSCWFSLTLPVLWRTVHCTLRVLNHLCCSFNFKFYWKLLQMPPTSTYNAVRCLDQLPWRHTPRFD